MTQEDIKYLKRFETNFKTAVNHNYTTAIPSTYMKKIVEIYEKYSSKITVCYHCSGSILSALKTIGRWYFNKIEILKENENLNNTPKEEIKEDGENKTIKGRKRK